MAAPARRHRSSTAASRMPAMNNQIAELRSLADELVRAAETPLLTAAVLQSQSSALRRIRQLLIDSAEKTQTKDAFRYVHGFDVLLQTLRSLAGFYTPAISPPDRIDFFDVIRSTLDVLSDALDGHSGNKRFFATRVEDGGWASLEQALADTGICDGLADGAYDGPQQLFGCLFAFALGDEAMTRIFRDVERPKGDAESESVPESSSSAVARADPQALRERMQRLFSGTEVLQNPDIMPIILHFWARLSAGEVPGMRPRALSQSVLIAVLEIIRVSTHNKAAVHVTGVLSTILPIMFEETRDAAESGLLRELADVLVEYGINKLDDAYFLFRKAATSVQAAEFLHQGMQTSRGPPFIQFDLSLDGFSAIELPELGRPFPPVSPGSGYTFAAWVRIDKHDPNCHTTIFGAYDDTQTCFLMAYLEKDTRCFILQTYMGHAAGVVPSVRFKKAPRFEQGRWYHIAVVHRRAKAIGLGAPKASLYVNGEFTETMKAHYPSHPPVLEGSHESFASISSNSSKQHSILAFLGTPRNLAPRLGRNVLQSKLSIASFHLFSEPLSDELIAVYHKLGTRYNGNFQDRLGSFQTYRTSAELHVQNEILHPGKEERSDIVSAIRSRAGHLMPESKLLIGFSPTSVLDDDDRNGIDESQLIRSLSKESARVLHRYTRVHGTPIIINAAVPSVNDALTQPRGFGRLSGSPVVVVPQALDDTIWRIGGCAAVGLKLLQSAETLDAVLRAVKILLEAVEGNWRNCEAMEQNSGFAVLAEVLSEKLSSGPRGSSKINARPEERESFILQLLRVLLRFVGYDEAEPADSLIINPLAYRVLIVDLDLWKTSGSLETQKLYYTQFIHFAKGSKHHHYNAKRFHRIRVVKRLTDALKGETFDRQMFPYFLDAFKGLLQINFNGENCRSLSLFVTYALHDSRAAYAKRTLRPKTSVLRLRKASSPALTPGSTPRSASPNHETAPSPLLSLGELGVEILQVLAELVCDKSNYTDAVRFAKAVTVKWLLYLFAESDQRVVVLGAKILARLLIANGHHYVKKFADKSGGFIHMKQRLKNWWNTPGIWTICFAILFDRDVASIDFERSFDVHNLVDIFITGAPRGQLKIVYPEVFPVIVGMLATGLRAIVKDPGKQTSEPTTNENEQTKAPRGRRRTMSLTTKQSPLDPTASQSDRLNDYATVLNSAIQFLAELHERSEVFRDYAGSSNYIQELLFVLYPLIVTSDSVSAETELNSRGSTLTFEGQDVVIKPLSRANEQRAPVIRTASSHLPSSPSPHRVIPFRRASSFVLVSEDRPRRISQPPQLNPILSSPPNGSVPMRVGSTVVEAMVELVIAVFKDQLFGRKDFPGLGLFLKTPPGFQEHQAYFESHLLRQTLSSVTSALQFKIQSLHEPRVLINLSRFVTHLSEAVFEGWFLEGAEPLLDFAGFLLEYLERPGISSLKTVRLCAQAVGTIRSVFLRVVLDRLAEPDESEGERKTVAIIDKMIYWQPIILSSENVDSFFLKLICYLLYTKLSSENQPVRLAAANFWRLLLVQKPDDTSAVLIHAVQGDRKELYKGFKKLTELDNETFLLWFDENRNDLDAYFYGTMTRNWEEYTHEQNKRTEDSAQKRISRRKDRLRQWMNDDLHLERTWTTHENATNHWRSNIHASERIKHQRVLQDQQENTIFLATIQARLNKQLRGPCALFESSPVPKWRLDETEGRDRKRMRTIIDSANREQQYQPKRRDTDPISTKLMLDTAIRKASEPTTVLVTPMEPMRPSAATVDSTNNGMKEEGSESDIEEDFEMVEAMLEDDDGFEDKNRKVMRSLNRGDQVQYVCNVSRVVGLEAIEGLLIVGKDCLYLLDDFFQRSDGEIVRVWQAPADERDIYVQLIAGDKAVTNRRQLRDEGDVARNWKWNEVISISKRHFLHRDVAIEIFFDDGRSYLMTAISPTSRNEIHAKLIGRAPQVVKPELLAHSEISWRLDSLRNPEEAPQTIGSRFASAFSSNAPHPSTKKWLKGEISNFHYLMFINTLAGRSFNDLTQYPVFPWVIADYTSEELDLTNPRTFRDLRRPIGCQNPVAEENVRERYMQLLEMGEEHPWHYGTHYSSATTVASYLVRLQPFCAAFTLIHDRKFDHADRMFYSIANAWNSASRANSADVRELTPEFFYLPEFLTNLNGYDFGVRANGQSVNDVALPPWAKGDPEIFIAKQREALESPYVSEHLHHWIDLIFGYQQRGEAAVEALNVYHYTTYKGIVDVDLLDKEERVRHVQSVNNFGQTPSQVFTRPHPQKEAHAGKLRRLDTSAESLTRVPGTLLETNDRISSLAYITKYDKLLCSAPFRHNIPPHYYMYMEWGFTDGSVRFYESHSKKLLGLFERLHSGQLTTSLFVDGRTLITAGTDCTVAIWNVKSEKHNVELQNTTILFGHRKPVITLAASAAFKALLSASTDGKVFLWDLNHTYLPRTSIVDSDRSEFVRELDLGPAQRDNPVPVQAAKINNVTGHIVLACGPRLIVTTLNGKMLMEQDVCVGDEENGSGAGITSLAVYEGVGSEWCERELIFTGHRRGVVKIFQLSPDRTGTWCITLLSILNHTDSTREDGKNVASPITCILPMPHNVYTGDEEGRVVRFSHFHLHGRSGWTSRKAGWEGQVEWKGGKETRAVAEVKELWKGVGKKKKEAEGEAKDDGSFDFDQE